MRLLCGGGDRGNYDGDDSGQVITMVVKTNVITMVMMKGLQQW